MRATLVKETKIYANGLSNMTKMAAMPIYGKIFKRRPMTLGLSIKRSIGCMGLPSLFK